MKKLITSLLLTVYIISSFVCVSAEYSKPQINAKSAILIDASTGQIIYEKDMDAKKFPASTTKIMTAILAIENLELTDMLTADEETIDSVPRDTSNIALDYGEEISVEDLLYATLLASGNDSSNVLAKGVSGSLDEFAKFMNEKAKEFGARNTNFANANGLHDENHYTSAYDLAQIMRHAISNETFCKVINTVLYDAMPTNKQEEVRTFANSHQMIKTTPYAYQGTIGGKTGWTTDAGHTLVTACERNGTKLIAVVMESGEALEDKFAETVKLFDYGFDNFDKIVLTSEKLQHQFEGTDIAKKVDTSMLYDAEFLIHTSEKGNYITQFNELPEDKAELVITTESGNVLYSREYTIERGFFGKFFDILKKIFIFIFKAILWIIGIAIVIVLLMIIINKLKKIRRKRRYRIKSYRTKYYR